MRPLRKFYRSRKGFSTIFGGLFFIILILMGFNLMLWNFIQYDAYTKISTSMGLRDQQAQSENLVVNAPGAVDFGPNSFNITANNQGGVAIRIVRIYVINLSPIASSQCQSSACIVDASPTDPGFSAGNIQQGENNHEIKVSGLKINDGSGYKVLLSSSRGRQFSFFYPWPVNMFGGSNSNATNTAHGALDVKFDLYSFNFTRGSQTIPQPAWTIPYAVNMVFWVKVINNSVYNVTLSKWTSLYFVCYQDRFGSGVDVVEGAPACTETDDNFLVDKDSMNPNSLIAYNEAVDPYVLPAAGPNGPNGYTIVKFGSLRPAQATPQDVDFPTPYLVFMGFFYKIQGQIMGQTISFVAVRACATYPSCP